MAADVFIINVDAKPRPVERFGVAARGRDRLRGDVFSEGNVGERQAPGDVGDDASGV